jgi:hypothetical protein
MCLFSRSQPSSCGFNDEPHPRVPVQAHILSVGGDAPRRATFVLQRTLDTNRTCLHRLEHAQRQHEIGLCSTFGLRITLCAEKHFESSLE